jgi:mono/diheme cytochrome c family protein
VVTKQGHNALPLRREMKYYRLMDKYFRSLISLLGAALILATPLVVAQDKTKEAPATTTNASSGADLYLDHCASCHGADGHGVGPATDALKTRPNDLTMIAKQNNGKYDTRYLKHVIQGDKNVTAHGSREMPSWGTKFRSMNASPSEVDKRLNLLVEYIHTIQR